MALSLFLNPSKILSTFFPNDYWALKLSEVYNILSLKPEKFQHSIIHQKKGSKNFRRFKKKGLKPFNPVGQEWKPKIIKCDRLVYDAVKTQTCIPRIKVLLLHSVSHSLISTTS